MSSLRSAALLVVLAACSPELGDGPHALPGSDEKSDNYITSNQREFDLSGEATATLPDNFLDYREIDQPGVAQDMADERYKEIVWGSIDAYIQDRLTEANGAGDGWKTLFGVFSAPPEDWKYSMYWRPYHGVDAEIIEITDTTVRFRFSLGFLGSPEFQDFLTDKKKSDRQFFLDLPASEHGDEESITVDMEPSDSKDAFPKYDVLFADGVFDVGVHMGGDYNNERYDLDRGRWFVDDFLLEEGWVSTTGVTNFDELTINSGPFVKDLIVEGKPVEARIFITHADMSDSEGGETLVAAVRETLKNRDVFIYAGHAGANHGFILDYSPRVDFSPSMISDAEMRSDYQVFAFQGCGTYHTLVGDVTDNPSKTFDNVDIVTTFNSTPFSTGYTVLEGMVEWLTLTSERGEHYPVSWMRILDRFNAGKGETVMYGVHGVEQDPQINPNGSEGIACTPCSATSQCGAGGNFCLAMDDGGACGVACTTDEACEPGSECIDVFATDYFHHPKQCVPKSRSCNL